MILVSCVFVILAGLVVGRAVSGAQHAPPSVATDGSLIQLPALAPATRLITNPAVSRPKDEQLALRVAASDTVLSSLIGGRSARAVSSSATTGLVDEGSGVHHWVALTITLPRAKDINLDLPYHFVGVKSGKAYDGRRVVRATGVTELLAVVDVDAAPPRLLSVSVDPADLSAHVIRDSPPIPVDEYNND